MPKVAWAAAALAALLLLSPQAHAAEGYRLCNRTGYVLDAALAIEAAGATATQGWFRILPGACETVLSGGVTVDRFFVHTRTPPVYGERPEAATVTRMFCVGWDDFLLPGAQGCGGETGVLAPFTEITEDLTSDDARSDLTDGSGMDLAAARSAGLKRLLFMAGYPPGSGEDTLRAALDLFRADHEVGADASDARLFGALMRAAAARSPAGRPEDRNGPAKN